MPLEIEPAEFIEIDAWPLCEFLVVQVDLRSTLLARVLLAAANGLMMARMGAAWPLANAAAMFCCTGVIAVFVDLHRRKSFSAAWSAAPHDRRAKGGIKRE